MNIKFLLIKLFYKIKKRYCPKCCIPMELTIINSNSKTMNGSTCLQCPQCRSILYKAK